MRTTCTIYCHNTVSDPQWCNGLKSISIEFSLSLSLSSLKGVLFYDIRRSIGLNGGAHEQKREKRREKKIKFRCRN